MELGDWGKGCGEALGFGDEPEDTANLEDVDVMSMLIRILTGGTKGTERCTEIYLKQYLVVILLSQLVIY